MKLRRNMGTAERWIRAVGGIIAIGVGIIFATKLPIWGVVVIIILGLSLVIEAALSWCPLKAMLGRGKQN